MNVGIITSFVVGGLLLLSLLALNNQVMEQTTNSTLNMYAKQKMDQVSEIVSNDFKNVGQYFGDQASISKFEDDEFVYWGSVYEDTTGNWNLSNTKVTYRVNKTDKVTETSNPNDFYVTRRVQRYNSSGTSVVETHTNKLPVSHFEMKFRTEKGDSTDFWFLIRYIDVEIITESPQPSDYDSNGDPIYERVMWEKRFYPENLQEYQ